MRCGIVWLMGLMVILGSTAFADNGTSSGGTSSTGNSNSVSIQGADEIIKCAFEGSKAAQTCYSEWGKCEGVETCTTKVSGPVGKEITWKSTCGGYATTTIDGKDEYANFKCSVEEKPVIVKESVKCVFNNSTKSTEACYSDYGKCEGNPSCVSDVQGDEGTTITWKSTCGGYAYTKLDGENEYAIFECGLTTTPNPPVDIAKETVKCVFEGSDKEEGCWRAGYEKTACRGAGACTVDIDAKKGENIMWKSTCGGYAYTVMDGKNEYAYFKCAKPDFVNERVKCVFKGSENEQKCYTKSTLKVEKLESSKGGASTKPSVAANIVLATPTSTTSQASQGIAIASNAWQGGACSGVGSCITEIFGKKGDSVVWGSSCGGEAITVMTGEDKKIEFECLKTERMGVDEEVKCIFKGSPNKSETCYNSLGQECKSDIEVAEAVACKEGEPCPTPVNGKVCKIKVKGPKGTEVLWKSTCGGYATTILDGKNEYAKFDCRYTEEPTLVIEPIDSNKTGSIPVPEPKYCSEGDTRAYDCGDGTKVMWCSCIGSNWRCIETPEKACQKQQEPPKCEGCQVAAEKRCMPIGTRLAGDIEVLYNPVVDRAPMLKPIYCDLDKKLKEQKIDGAACQNSYECTSNTCSDGKCINIQQQLAEQRNILQQILDWLSGIFGFKPK